MDIELPGFDIERELGEGAMATVYLATQRSLQRKVALKVMAAALAADPSFAERFLREGRTLARLSREHGDHPRHRQRRQLLLHGHGIPAQRHAQGAHPAGPRSRAGPGLRTAGGRRARLRALPGAWCIET